jgi:hypothetical protein
MISRKFLLVPIALATIAALFAIKSYQRAHHAETPKVVTFSVNRHVKTDGHDQVTLGMSGALPTKKAGDGESILGGENSTFDQAMCRWLRGLTLKQDLSLSNTAPTKTSDGSWVFYICSRVDKQGVKVDFPGIGHVVLDGQPQVGPIVLNDGCYGFKVQFQDHDDRAVVSLIHENL